MTPEQIEDLKKQHSNALEAAKNQITAMQRQLMAGKADNMAIAQTVNELLQANIGLRSKAIQDEENFRGALAEKTAQINALTSQLATATSIVADTSAVKK